MCENMKDESLIATKKLKRKSPQHEKQLDYKNQRRTSEDGKGWRKTVAKLPRLERRRYRQAQERALHDGMFGQEELGSNAADNVRALRRSNFGILHHRREMPLGKRISLKQAGIARIRYRVRHGRKKGRHWLSAAFVAIWVNMKERDGD